MENIKQLLGFTLEVFSFVLSGFFLGINKLLIGNLLLIFAFVCAVWTGNQIKKDAVEDYKNGP